MATSAQFKVKSARFMYVKGMFERVKRTDDNGNPILDKNGKPVTEQQCTLVFDRSMDMTPFNKAMEEVILAEWGEKGLANAKAGLIRSPILAGDGKEARIKKGARTGEIADGLGPDKFFVRVATRLECPVRYRSPTIPATHGNGPDQIKSGDYGVAVLHAYTWRHSKNGDGISFGIDYLQKTRDGDPLGGAGAGVDTDEVYEKIEDAGETPASVKGGAGAGGLFG